MQQSSWESFPKKFACPETNRRKDEHRNDKFHTIAEEFNLERLHADFERFRSW